MYDMYRRKSLKTLGNNGSNYLLGRSVASKLRPQQAAKAFLGANTEISEKQNFFINRSVPSFDPVFVVRSRVRATKCVR